MRQHPIPPVSEPLQYRAIGVVRGVYEPSDAAVLTRGVIRTADGQAIESVVLGRLLTLMRRHLDLSLPHLWVVYPRSREEGQLHLQMVGIWEPSTLSSQTDASGPVSDGADTSVAGSSSTGASGLGCSPTDDQQSSDGLPEGDDYFSVRGELIFTRPETGDFVVKVRQLPRPDGERPIPFKLQLRGDIPLEHLRHFVSLDLRRQEQALQLERLEVLSPIAQRGNRGGKGRRPAGAGAGRGTEGGGRRGDDATSQAARSVETRPTQARNPEAANRSIDPRATTGGRSHSRAVSRPPR